MKTRRRNYSDDPLTITRRNTRAKKTSVIKITDNSSDEPIPIDLIIEIFSRLPTKSVAKCRCVSKLWYSILRRPDFTELFLTRSQTRPQLLFVCKKEGKYLFFSSPQPQNPDVNSSPAVCANLLMHYRRSCEIWGHVHGLVCLVDESKGDWKETVAVIYNPSTGQSLPLPRLRRVWVYSYLVYDPVDKQFKVLSISLISSRIKLLVLEDAEKNEWSKHKFVLPDSWQNIVGMQSLRFVGMTRTNEIVFVPLHSCVPFCVIYYNMERNTITKVRIRGMEAFGNGTLLPSHF